MGFMKTITLVCVIIVFGSEVYMPCDNCTTKVAHFDIFPRVTLLFAFMTE